MEEKKVTKVSMSTFFLIIAIIAMVVMGVFIYKFNDDKNKANNEVADLKNKVNALENTIKTNEANKNNTVVDNTSTNGTSSTSNNTNSSITDFATFKNIVKGLQNEIIETEKIGLGEGFRVTNIKKENNKYLLSIDVHKPIIVTNAQHDEMLKTKKFAFNGIEYQYSEEDDLLVENGRKTSKLSKVKDGYVFVTLAGKGFIKTQVTDSYLVYFEADTVVHNFDNSNTGKTLSEVDPSKSTVEVDYDANNDSLFIRELYY